MPSFTILSWCAVFAASSALSVYAFGRLFLSKTAAKPFVTVLRAVTFFVATASSLVSLKCLQFQHRIEVRDEMVATANRASTALPLPSCEKGMMLAPGEGCRIELHLYLRGDQRDL